MKRIVTPYTATVDYLASDESIVVTKNIVRTAKRMTFTADITALGEARLFVGHGYMQTNASWLEITSTEIAGYSYFSFANPQLRELGKEKLPHKIDVNSFITVSIDYTPEKLGADVVITSAGGTYKCFLSGWCGADGDVFARFSGIDARNVKLNWSSDDLAKPIWLVGDSYTGFGYDARWPYYLKRDGYFNLLIMGYSGMSCDRGIAELREIIDNGEPEFIVWALGMNNGDKIPGEINKSYLAATEEFIALCVERGITPILCTVPNTPKVNNREKNAWVRSSGYRYIDFARAVGSDSLPGWYPEMIYTDNVHPASLGAAALYAQVTVDFPEIMQR